jgi:hypothetical protein
MPGEDPKVLPEPSEVAELVFEMLSPSYALNDQRVNFRDTAYFKSK